MVKQKIKISAGALILAAAAYYFCEIRTLAALAIPIFVHELGHIAALLMLGFGLRGFRAELKGLCIVYSGSCGAVGHAMAAAAGPMVGLIYAAAASWGGNRLQSDWLCLSAGVSLPTLFLASAVALRRQTPWALPARRRCSRPAYGLCLRAGELPLQWRRLGCFCIRKAHRVL